MTGLISNVLMLPMHKCTSIMWIVLLILQDLNEGALISAQSSSNVLDKVGKITGSVVGFQLNCYNIELHTYLSIYSTQLSIEDIVLCSYTAIFTVIVILCRISLSALRKG